MKNFFSFCFALALITVTSVSAAYAQVRVGGGDNSVIPEIPVGALAVLVGIGASFVIGSKLKNKNKKDK